MKATVKTVAIALVAAALPCFAADTVEWNGTSGNWSDGAIWEGGEPPTKDQIAGFKSGRSGTVTIDGNFEVYAVQIKQHASDEYPVTFAGTGALVATGTTFIVNTSRRLIIDGPSVTARHMSVMKALDVKSGSLICTEFLRAYAIGAAFAFTGGEVDVAELKISRENCLMAMTNATVRLGTITGTPLYAMSGGSFSVRNGGLTFAAGVTEAHLGVDFFVLGGDLSATDEGTVLMFDRATTLGAYGDWRVDDAKISSVRFGGNVTFATTDAADGETGRTITVPGLALASDYDSVCVTGTGTAHLTPASTPFRLDTLSIGDGATLNQNFDSIGVVSARRIDMGEGAAIACKPSYVSFEMESSSIAPAAAVRLNVASASKDRYQVWTDFSGGEKPAFSLSGDAAWSVREAGPFAFVSNGSAVSYDKATCWIGTGGDALWSTAGNWNGTVPGTSSPVAYFYSDEGTLITNDSARTVSRLWMGSNSGAFAFFGEPIALGSTVTNANNSPIYLAGVLPVAVYNTLSRSGSKATGLSFASASRAFIALMGEVALTNLIFRFSGDMRVGGNVNCASVIFDEAKSATKPSACTILPGAEVVATAQAFVQEEGVGYYVRPGGVLEVRSGVWDWMAPVTNRIDGTLRLGARLGTTAVTYFSGRGTIELSGAAAVAGAELRTTPDFAGALSFPDGICADMVEGDGCNIYTLRTRIGIVVSIR